MAVESQPPAITLTDPNNDPGSPAAAFSPTRDGASFSRPPDVGGFMRNGVERPTTPTKKQGGGRSGRSVSPGGSWTSPTKLIRSLSSSNGNTSAPSWGEARSQKEGDQEHTTPALDPLSQHILKRTHAPPPPVATNGRPFTADTASKDDIRTSAEQMAMAPAVQSLKKVDTSDSLASQPQAHKDLRKGVKAVAFISRLIGNKKKDEELVAPDDEVDSNESRPEGTEAEVFAQSVDNIGYSPRQPQPPSYIKVQAKHKKVRDFDHLFLAQQLECRKRKKAEKPNVANKLRRKGSVPGEADTVWAMEFSKDGKYLAAAGADGIVRVWAVLSSLDDRQKHEKQEAAESEANGVGAHSEHLSAPVFLSQPIREFEGHTSTVLDLSWSKNNFLLSSSMDKTVRLWHVTRSECLCTFQHADFVPSIVFHPKDDRFFLAGSLDSKLRLWSIPDKSVAYTARVHDMVTAVSFTPDGKCAIAGCLNGVCMFYETEGLKYQSQVHVRSARGQNAKGSKITGIQARHDFRGDVKLLITSNDSRVRLYNFRDKNLEMKFRGNENNSSQIRASISDDGRYIVCGSEDRKAYIWSLGPCENEKRDRRPMEMFEAHDTITTVVCMAPTKTRQALAKSEDPVYDLCNPPPITLLSRAERAESQGSSRPPTENGSFQATPADVKGTFEKPKESASYLNRSTHRNGNIIVTADYTGQIKVFRQDCAWSKRKTDDDRASIFSKRTGKLSRTGSNMTRGSQPSTRESRTSISTTGPSDRILSWRQSITSSPNLNGTNPREPDHTSRSISPRSMDQRGPKDQSPDARRSPKARNGRWSGSPARGRSKDATGSTPLDMKIDTAKARAAADTTSGGSPRSGSSRSVQEDNPLMLAEGRSLMFWNAQEWKERADRMHARPPEMFPLSPVTSKEDAEHLAVRPGMERGVTAVSRLSDERSSGSEYDDAAEEHVGR